MLNTQNLLNKMLEHFPRWMDIRKRATSSIGGQLLEAVADETATLQTTLEDFKKDFFIDSYFGKEEDIVDFVCKIQVGDVDINVLKIVSHDLDYTDDLNVFYKQTGVFYYEAGYIFFRIEDVADDKIEYTLNDYYFVEETEKMHVWNIFDEFATFVGLERHQWETNKQLESRILNVFKNKMNNTKDGLKHAIFTELMMLDPNISLDEISIEGVTPENLRKKYDEFNTVLDKLSSVNKDCYKYKKWDIDPWYYSINSIDYIPHAWDVALEAFKDGVGKSEDLNIILSSPNDTTDASIIFYKKNVAELEEYLKNSNTKTNIELTLTKYNEELKPIPAKYKITASKANDITNESIKFQYSDVKHVDEDVYIMDIISKDADGNIIGEDIQVNDYTLLPKNKKFKLKFKPHYSLKPLKIAQCDLKIGGSIKSLLKENQDFVLVSDQLVYKHCRKYADKINDFTKTTNLVDTPNGLSIHSIASEGEAILNIDGLGLERVSFDYGCEKSNIDRSKITTQNFDLVDDVYVSYSASGDTKLSFEIEANYISFNTSGDCRVSIYRNNEQMCPDFELSGIQKYESAPFKEMSTFRVEILSLNNLQMLAISNLKHTAYSIQETLEHGAFSSDGLGLILPNIDKNHITIKMKSYFDKSPYIKEIYIGAPYDEDFVYETEVFTTDEDTHVYIKKEHMYTELVLIDSNNNEDYNSIFTDKDFTPYLEYQSLSSTAYIQLDLTAYIKINKITTDKGTLRSYIKGGQQCYYIELKKDTIISMISISGIVANNIQSVLLTDLFNVVPSQNHKLYITNLYDGFIVEKNNVQTRHSLSDIEEIKLAFKYGMFKFLNLPREYNQVYALDVVNDSMIVSNNGYNGSIKNAVIKLKDKQNYIAYNEHQLIQKKKTMIQIEDTFSPFLPAQQLFYYELTMISPNIDIQFHDFDEMYYETIMTGNKWTVGKKYICMEARFDITDSNNFLAEVTKANKEYKLEKTIGIDFMTELDNGTTINLCRYVIETPPGISIEYTSIDPNETPVEFAPDYFGLESMFKQIDGFNKLQYCNIDQIIQFGVGDPNSDDFFNITEEMYELLPEEGIIVWSESAPEILDYSDIYIKYTIRIPNNFLIDEDLLYKKTNYTIKGYSFLKKLEEGLINIPDDGFIDLSKELAFKVSDRTVIQCTNPSFDAYVETDGIRFKRTVEDYALYAKSGYYYMDGMEYYMFAEETSEKTDKVMNVIFNNTTKDEEGIHMQKSSHNYINNSLLFTEGIGNVFSKNFVNDSNISGASALNAVTACSSFNHWKNVGCDLAFVDGHNGVGLSINPFITDGYAYVEITDSLFEETLVSFYANGETKGYIGKERKNGNLKYPDSDSIELIGEIKPSLANANIMSYTFRPDHDFSYYLVVKGKGVVDDIIVCNSEYERGWDFHKKNLSTLGLEVSEQIMEDYTNRLFFYNTKGYKNLGAEIDNTDTIVNSALINWGLTKTKEYNEYADWNYCELNNINIENNMLVSKTTAGYIMTEPIYTGDVNIIKSLTLKINDVEFNQTSGFVTTVYTCNEHYGVYELRTSFKDNICTINEKEVKQLGKYIKIKIEMPPNKVVNSLSLFTEYKESEKASPIERVSHNGQLLSEIYDAQYQSKYKLTDINIKKLSNITDVQIEIRAARSNKDENIWTEWKPVNLGPNYTIQNELVFDNYRFFQLKISLKQQDAFIKINYLDLKVVR